MSTSLIHRRRVAVQQRVHETRRLLLEAAERLREVDEAANRDEADRATATHDEALALLSASTQQMRALGGELRGDIARVPRPQVAAIPLELTGALSRSRRG